jgi:iron(III) transport system permease protein
MPRPALRGARAAVATLVCSVPLAVGFLIPVLLLVRLVAGSGEVLDATRFLTWSWNSFRVAAMAAALAVAAAGLIAYAARLAPGPMTRLASQLLPLGYAVPGTVLAVGVLLPVGAVDRALADAVRDATGISPGLLLTGSVFALLYAYLVRYFAVAWNGIEPGFARITPAMDQAARSLGAGSAELLLRVHAPLLARTRAAAILIEYVDVMKELPATHVLRPFNYDTIATQTYQLARDERLAEAALPSLAIVLVGLAPMLLLARSGRSRAPAVQAIAPAV